MGPHNHAEHPGQSSALRKMVPCGFFPQLWMRLSGALQKKRSSELSYREIVKNSSNDETIAAKQVTQGGQERPCVARRRKVSPGWSLASLAALTPTVTVEETCSPGSFIGLRENCSGALCVERHGLMVLTRDSGDLNYGSFSRLGTRNNSEVGGGLDLECKEPLFWGLPPSLGTRLTGPSCGVAWPLIDREGPAPHHAQQRLLC